MVKQQSRTNQNREGVELARAVAGDGGRGSKTSAPVKDGVGEVGVYVGSFRATHLACHSQ